MQIKKECKLARGGHKTRTGCTGKQKRYGASTGEVMGQRIENQQFVAQQEQCTGCTLNAV